MHNYILDSKFVVLTYIYYLDECSNIILEDDGALAQKFISLIEKSGGKILQWNDSPRTHHGGYLKILSPKHISESIKNLIQEIIDSKHGEELKQILSGHEFFSEEYVNIDDLK